MENKVLRKIISYCWRLIFNADCNEWFITKLAQLSRTNLLDLAHSNLGLLKCETLEISGERNFIQNILPRILNESAPVLLDIGAHLGEYSTELRQSFPNARIIAFEPNPASFSLLESNLLNSKVECNRTGISDTIHNSSLFTYSNDQTASHASIFVDTLSKIHGAKHITSFECQFETLDSIVEKLNIEKIGFIKIDVEGAELDVLKGGKKLLASAKIPALQFEFNEMNVFSRTYLRDFYDLLENYSFFRITPKGLLALGDYHPKNEIFRFQNILCTLKNIPNKEMYVP